jgi:uncharacterized protein YuzE
MAERNTTRAHRPIRKGEEMKMDFYTESEAVYITFQKKGKWAKSQHPHELLTLDFDNEDRLIGIEAIGSLAKSLTINWYTHPQNDRL